MDGLYPSGAGGVVDGSAISGADAFGQRLAKRRAEAVLARLRRYHGQGDHIGLGAGTILTLAGGNTSWLVVRSRLRLEPRITIDTQPTWVAEGPLRTALVAQARERLAQWRGTALTAGRYEGLDDRFEGFSPRWQDQALDAEIHIEAVDAGSDAPIWRPVPPERGPQLAGVHVASVASASATSEKPLTGAIEGPGSGTGAFRLGARRSQRSHPHRPGHAGHAHAAAHQ